MAAVPADVHGPSDAELIEQVRAGDLDAYGSLYQRHVSAAYNLARQLSRSTAEADDLVSEAFARVLDTLRAGRGPDSAFRAYLLTSLRHVAYDRTRKERRVELTEDVTTVSGVSTEKISEPFRDTAMAGLERSLAAKAFARLPERWQAVLWHTEIEGQSPAEVAPLLGLTANGVSALAYRAREGLRQAYLQVHLAETTAGRCRATADKLGAWTRGGLSKRETAQVESHLDECERCRALAAELADVNGGLRVVATLVLGVGTAGYLAATTTKTAAVATAAATGASAGAAAGAAGSVPRQLAGVGASVAALVAALALALVGGTTQQIPTAATVPPPARTAPAPPARPPAQPPAPPAPPPAQPPAPPAPPVVPPVVPPPNVPPPTVPAAPPNPAPPPAAPPTTTAPPPTTTPPPVPGAPTLTASGPPDGLTLVPGQGAMNLPVTVRNTGTAASDPVTATLRLPPGVTAIGEATPHVFQAHPISERFRSASPADTSTVNCPGGTGTVTCQASALAAGQAETLLFRLVAEPGAAGGTITGSVTAGTTMSADFDVRVRLSPPPQVDALVLSARFDLFDSWWGWLWDGSPVIDVVATNTGTSTKPVTVTVDRPGSVWAARPDAECSGGRHSVTCVSAQPLAPHRSLHLRVRIYHLPAHVGVIGVTGSLGTARASTSVTFRAPRCGWPWCWPVGPIHGHPPTATTTPPTTTPPDTTTPGMTTTPGTTTTEPPSTSSPGPPSSTTTEPPSSTTTEPSTPDTTTTVPPPSSTTTTKPTTKPPTKPPPTAPGCPTGTGRIRPGAICLPLVPALFDVLGRL